MFLRNIFHKIITGLLSPFVISLLNVEVVESKTIPFLLLPEYTYNKNKPSLGFFYNTWRFGCSFILEAVFANSAYLKAISSNKIYIFLFQQTP